MDTPIFEQITSALTVKSICSPLGPDIPADSTESDLDPTSTFDNPSRVIGSNGRVIGVMCIEDITNLGCDDSITVGEIIEQLEPNEYLSSGTTILDAVELFCSKPNRYFYVIHANDIVGIIYYRDLFKPIGRLAFLALALEIEDHALASCRSPSINVRCWQSLSENRKCKALELFELRYGREPNFTESIPETDQTEFLPRKLSDISLLIGCTTLSDKATMIWKQRLISTAAKAEVLGFFNDLKEIRDHCAHPGREEELVPKHRLAHFVNSAKHMRNNLRESLQKLR
jgi:hypothetical protein